MNYTKIYVSIILRAQAERTERIALKKQGTYFENHHIVPRSLGGKNTIDNMALLYGREHFICHWLLVKMYKPGTREHRKMLYALWRMRSIGKEHVGRYINAHAYEYYRHEYACTIAQVTSKSQTGNGNSQYGSTWYTNAYDGTSCKSKANLQYPWVKGRRLFSGESSPLYKKQQLISMQLAKSLWDSFHMSQYSSFSEFAKNYNGRLKRTGILALFKKYIPLSRKIWNNATKAKIPQPQYIGQYF